MPELVGLRDELCAQIRQSVLILFAVVLLVLLTASANVAQLLLARTMERQQELALRSALGASRSRLIQQLTVEATALTLTGCGLGMVVAVLVARVAGLVLPAQLAAQNYTLLDWRVLCFAVGVAIVAGIALGMMPAWLLGSIGPSTHLGRVRSGSGHLAGIASTSSPRGSSSMRALRVAELHQIRCLSCFHFPRGVIKMGCLVETGP